VSPSSPSLSPAQSPLIVDMVAALGSGFMSFFITFGAIAKLTVRMLRAMVSRPMLGADISTSSNSSG